MWCERKVGISLESKQVNRPSSRDEVGNMGLHLSYGRNLGFPLSCDGYLREPLELHKGSQASFQVSRGNSGLHSRLCRVIRPHVVLRRECLFFFFKLQGEAWGSSRVKMRTSENLSCCLRDVRPPFYWQGSPRYSSHVAAGE